MPRFNAQSVGSDIAQAFSAQIKGKTVLVTGGTLGGLGAEFAATIVKHAPRLVILTTRSQDKFEETATAIRSITPDAPLRSLLLDTSSMANVRRAAAEVNGWPETVDVVLHNLGVAGCPINRTEDGMTQVIASNHAGPFLLTSLLMPKLLADGRSPRIVVVGSGAHGMVKTFRWDDPHYLKEDEYEPGTQYAESKVLNQLLGPALVRKSSGRVKAYTCSPGLVLTQLFRHTPEEQKRAYGFLDAAGNIDKTKFRTTQQGICSYLIAAFDPELDATPGVHISSGLKVAPEDVGEHAKGEALEDRMWAATEDWVGERFRF